MAQIQRHRGPGKKLIEAAEWWAQGCPGSNWDEIEADLRDQEWSDEAIELERIEAERLAEPGVIWPVNWTAVQVFSKCKWGSQILFNGKVQHIGFAAAEIEASCRLVRVPGKEWPDTFERVRLMESAALKLLNARSD